MSNVEPVTRSLLCQYTQEGKELLMLFRVNAPLADALFDQRLSSLRLAKLYQSALRPANKPGKDQSAQRNLWASSSLTYALDATVSFVPRIRRVCLQKRKLLPQSERT